MEKFRQSIREVIAVRLVWLLDAQLYRVVVAEYDGFYHESHTVDRQQIEHVLEHLLLVYPRYRRS